MLLLARLISAIERHGERQNSLRTIARAISRYCVGQTVNSVYAVSVIYKSIRKVEVKAKNW